MGRGLDIMLDFAEQRRYGIDVAMPRRDPVTAAALLHRLRQLRVRPRLACNGRGFLSCGLPLRIAVNQYLDSGAAAAEVNERVVNALAAGVPLTLALGHLEQEPAIEHTLEAFCIALKAALRNVVHAADLVSVSLRSHMLPIQAFLVITSILGRGPRYVMLDSLQMQDHADLRVQAMSRTNWLELCHRRDGVEPARAVYSESVRSRCALLADEKTASILPSLAMPVPAGTAWLPLEIFLPDYSDGGGHLHIPTLRSALRACLDIADELSPLLNWPCAEQQRDLQANNRIALLLTGIGDLVCERQLDPGEIRSLRWVERIVTAIQTELREYSGALARDHETLPSLLQSDPSNAWRSIEHKLAWSARWQQALEEQAVRHRNLLVLSPYSVLPRNAAMSPAFTDLLPVLAHADAVSFSDVPDLSMWSPGEFSGFHKRAWTVIMRECRRTRIAAGA